MHSFPETPSALRKKIGLQNWDFVFKTFQLHRTQPQEFSPALLSYLRYQHLRVRTSSLQINSEVLCKQNPNGSSPCLCSLSCPGHASEPLAGMEEEACRCCPGGQVCVCVCARARRGWDRDFCLEHQRWHRKLKLAMLQKGHSTFALDFWLRSLCLGPQTRRR